MAESGGKVFASAKGLSTDGKDLFTVRAYDGANSSALWTGNINLGADWNIATSVAAGGGYVVGVGYGETDDVFQTIIVACYNASTGAQLWYKTFNAGGDDNVAYDVCIYGGMAYVAGSARSVLGEGRFLVLAYDLTNGDLIWNEEIGHGLNGNAALAIFANGNGVFATGYVQDADYNKVMLLVNLKLNSGAVQWQATYDAGSGENEGTDLAIANGLAIVAGRGVIEGAYMTFVRAYSLMEGALQWSSQFEVASTPTHLVASGNNVVMTGLYEGRYYVECMNIFTGKQIWLKTVTNHGLLNFNSAVDVEGSLVVAAFYSQNSTEDGDYVWDINLCQFAMSDGTLVASNLTSGTGGTSEDVDILINSAKVYFTTGTEKEIAAPMAMATLSTETKATIDGYNITVNGKSFTFKGVNYSPSPINSKNSDYPWGDWFQDGARDFSYYKEMQERDIANLKAMGVNCIKVYSITGFRWDDPTRATVSHDHFYTELAEAGIYVIVQVYTPESVIEQYNDNRWDDGSNEVPSSTLAQWQAVINEAKKYPAVVGYNLGNEFNADNKVQDKAYWGKANSILGHIKKMDPNRFTAVAIVDTQIDGYIKPVYYQNTTMTNLDVWGINSYRGLSTSGFDNLFSKYREICNKPLLLTEFGCPEATEKNGVVYELSSDQAKSVATYLTSHWSTDPSSIEKNSAKNGGVCAGGFVFEYSDEWWKRDDFKNPRGLPYVQDNHGDKNGAFPGGYWEDEGCGLYKISVSSGDVKTPWQQRGIDTLTARSGVAALSAMYKA
ncbi:MAG: PQQ-binding-like beta-propeller repeat protein [Candidatus Saccharibacteria bacterium]